MTAVDTNVVSELMKVQPDPEVIGWAGAVDPADLAVPAIVAAELLRGLDRLPDGARRDRLERALDAFFGRIGDSRVLPLDARGAAEYAHVKTARDGLGRLIGPMDALVAATCRAYGAVLATRNTKDFVGVGSSSWIPGLGRPRRGAGARRPGRDTNSA